MSNRMAKKRDEYRGQSEIPEQEVNTSSSIERGPVLTGYQDRPRN